MDSLATWLALTGFGVSSAATPRSLPRQPSVRRRLLTHAPARLAMPSVTPSPWAPPFGSPPRRPSRGRSRGFCSAPVHEYRGSLRLLARHRRRLRLTAYTPSYPAPSGGTVRDLPG